MPLTRINFSISLWVSGTTYPTGALVYSPANGQSYRRLISGAGTTDPSLDSTNWNPLSIAPTTPVVPGSNIFLATNFGAL